MSENHFFACIGSFQDSGLSAYFNGHLVLLSEGVPEARSHGGELYGFDRLSSLTLMGAQDIAEAAHCFGQEDDITVLTLAFSAGLPRTTLLTDGLDVAP